MFQLPSCRLGRTVVRITNATAPHLCVGASKKSFVCTRQSQALARKKPKIPRTIDGGAKNYVHDVVDCCLFYRAGPRDALRAAGELPTSRKVYSVKDPLTKANWSQISSDRSKFAAPCRYQLPLHIIARKEITSPRKQEITAQSGDLTSCYNRLSIIIQYMDIHCTHQKTIRLEFQDSDVPV